MNLIKHFVEVVKQSLKKTTKKNILISVQHLSGKLLAKRNRGFDTRNWDQPTEMLME